MDIRKFLLLGAVAIMVTFLGVPQQTRAAGSSVVSLTGPTSVKVGQVFSVPVRLDPKGEDVDTLRINGTYPGGVLHCVGVTLSSEYPNSSPNSFCDDGSGQFSIGAFRIGKGSNISVAAAVITFKVKKLGTVNIQLDPASRAISQGQNRLANVNSYKTSVSGQIGDKFSVEQPIALPSEEEVAANPDLSQSIRLLSLTQPDPNTWYSNRDVQVVWETGGKAIKESYFSIDGLADSTPTTSISGQQAVSKVERDGIWFAHLLAVFDDGKTSRADLRLQVDATPPRQPNPVVDQDLVPVAAQNALRYGTTDDASGIEKYQVNLEGKTIDVTTTSLSLQTLEPGVHVATVTAVDKAGNKVSNDVSFQVVSVTSGATQATGLFGGVLSWLKTIGAPAAIGLTALLTCLIAIPLVLFFRSRRKSKREER
jgi:hypothetical protein